MRFTAIASGVIGACLLAFPAVAGDRATKEEAVSMVDKAVAAIKTNGAETAYAEISKKDGPFTAHDLYIVVYGLDGKCLAHGANAKLIGKDLSEAQDVDGKYYIRERLDLAGKNSNFWQSYKFTNPETKKVEPKLMYCQRLAQTAVCGGIYIP